MRDGRRAMKANRTGYFFVRTSRKPIRRAAALFSLLALSSLGWGEEPLPRWPSDLKAVVVESCSSQFRARAEESLRGNNYLSEDAFREKLEAMSREGKTVCNCVVDRI